MPKTKPSAPRSGKRSRGQALAGWLVTMGLSTAPLAAGLEPLAAITQAQPGDAVHFGVDDALADIVRNPAFAGLGQHLLPRPGPLFDADLKLSAIASLLPYHSNVHPEEIAGSLDRLAADALAGQQVFYPIYGENEIARDPAKADTGLFLLRGHPGAPFALIAPGGGFSYVGTVHEGLPYAQTISDLGYNAFVLRYRVGQGQRVATEDMAAALSFIFAHAEALDVGTNDYSVWGSSAGARMAALIGSHGVAAFGGDDLPGPAAVVMAYTSHADIAPVEPPTYVIVGQHDGIAPPSAMEARVKALRARGTSVQYRVVPGVAHGFGTGLGTPAEGWIADAVAFWQAPAP